MRHRHLLHLARSIMLCLIMMLSSTPVLYALDLSAPIGQEDADVADELGVIDSRVADIHLPALDLGVYPKQPSGNIATRNPFFHEAYPVIQLPSGSFYDETTRTLQFTVRLGRIPFEISNALVDEAKQTAATALNEGAAWEQIVILPLPLTAYQVYLVRGDQSILLREGAATNAQLGLGPNFPISKVIEEQWAHEALLNDVQSVNIEFRAFYRFKVFDVDSALIEIRQRVASETFEEVLGEGASNPALVTRDVLNQIQQRAERNIRVQLPAGASADLLTNLELFRAEFASLPPLTFDELTAINSTLYYRADEAQLEITPQVFKELTTSWSSSEEFRSSFQETWDFLRTLEEESNSTEEFYENLHTQYIGGGKAAAKVDILKLGGGSGSGSFNFDNTWDEQSSEQRSQFESFAEEIRSSSTVSEERLENIAEDWTGQREIANVTAQNLKLYRVSEANIEQVLSLVVDVIDELPSVLRYRPVSLPLIGSTTELVVDLDDISSELTSPVAEALMSDESFRAAVRGERGPEGPQGIQGIQGRTGTPGEPGPPGPVSKKLCSAVVGGNWRDTIRVNEGWEPSDCRNWATSVGAAHWQLACAHSGAYSWGDSAPVESSTITRPNNNCGW